MFPTRYVQLEAARLRFGDRVDRLGAFLSRGDPAADAAVLAIESAPRGVGWQAFEDALNQRPNGATPPAIRALVDEAADVPPWVDWDVCDRGGSVLMRAGLLGGIVLGARSLVLGYASPGGNKPLVFSGRLKEQAARRLNETARFVQAVSRPCGMRPFADGWQITLKVRLIHAQVRRMILASGRWDAAAWGLPVNQHDMAGTTLLFSVSILDGLRQLGLRMTTDDSEAYTHLWRWAGRVIGVDADILPAGEQDGLRLAALIEATTDEPDQDSRDLTAALFNGRMEGAKTAKEKRDAARHIAFGSSICRTLIGDELADKLGVQRSPFRYAMPMLRGFVGGLDRVRHAVPFADRRAIESGSRYWDRVVAVGLDGATAEFGLPDRLVAA